jgi:hypothetical protein
MNKCVICGEPFEPEVRVDDETGEVTVYDKMDADCARMIATSSKKREKELGSGPIKTTHTDGRWLQMDKIDEWSYIAATGLPEYEYQLEGQDVFDDKILMMRSIAIVRKILRRRGDYDVSLEDIEDMAAEAYTMFYESIENGMVIDNVHSYHGSLCNIVIKRHFTKKAQVRLSSVPIDIIQEQEEAWHEEGNEGEAPISYMRYGALSHLYERPSNERWTMPQPDGETWELVFDRGNLTKKERVSFLNMLRGDNLGFESSSDRLKKRLARAALKLRNADTLPMLKGINLSEVVSGDN